MAVERAPQVRRFAPPANGAKRGVRLEWEGKKAEIDVPVLPFQTIETINEPRQQLTLFSASDDARPAFPPGWKNKLIWGDNKLAMAALAEQYAGQVDLIYIDPPFDTGADFSVQVEVGDEEVTKEPSIIERHAYLDTWGRDGKLDSYLQWFYETVLLMHTLLSETGSLYVHLDWHVGHYGKVILDEVFGDTNFQSEIIREKSNPKNYTRLGYGNVHDVILFYSKTDRCRWNKPYSQRDNAKIIADFPNVDAQGRRYKTAPLHAPGIRRGETGQPWHNLMPPSGNHWRYVHATLEELDGAGDIEWSSTGNPRERIYADESAGVFMQDIWLGLKDVKGEYPSMKNSEVVDRIVGASSSPNDLVLDCFIGSGTTALAAERLGRRWIACDLGRFAVHTTRKRLLGWSGHNSERCRAFEILNLGHYEQQFWRGTENEETDDLTAKRREREYLRTMLIFYHARPLDGSGRIHGEKGSRAVHIGPLAESVSRMEAFEASEAARDLGFRGLDILGWEWDFESNETVKEDAKMRGVDLRLIQIPEEMLDGRARKLFQEGTLTFPELASLQVNIEALPGQSRSYCAHLDDFIIPPGTLPEVLRDRVTRWQDYIDYWSVDWEFGKDTPPGERDTFHNMWQTFRTKQRRTLSLVSEPHDYTAPGTYTVVVKVVDIFGNDTTVSRKVDVP